MANDIFDNSLADDIMKDVENAAPPKRPEKGSKPKPVRGSKMSKQEQENAKHDPIIAFALNKGMLEFEEMFSQWLDFWSAMSDTYVIAKYMAQGAEQFSYYMESFRDQVLLNKGNIPESEKEYHALARSKVIADLYNEYSHEYRKDNDEKV